MSKNLSSLNNIRTIRAEARNMDLDLLEELRQKFETVVSERREEENGTASPSGWSVDNEKPSDASCIPRTSR